MTAWDALAAEQQARIMGAIAADAPPSCVVMPRTVDELSRVMALSCENGWRVLPTGQGSKLSWGGLADGIDVVVSAARRHVCRRGSAAGRERSAQIQVRDVLLLPQRESHERLSTSLHVWTRSDVL